MKTLIILIACFVINIATAQSISPDIQSDPKLVLEEVFRAAKEKDYSNLYKLCPTDGSNDGDTQEYICNLASSSEETKREFISYFAKAKITGEVVYASENGQEMAQIPFWFDHPGGDGRSNETMNLIKINGKWYLLSF